MNRTARGIETPVTARLHALVERRIGLPRRGLAGLGRVARGDRLGRDRETGGRVNVGMRRRCELSDDSGNRTETRQSKARHLLSFAGILAVCRKNRASPGQRAATSRCHAPILGSQVPVLARRRSELVVGSLCEITWRTLTT